MLYSISKIKISLDNKQPVWHSFLVVSSDIPVSFQAPTRIKKVEENDNITTTTIYTTRGLWKKFQENGKYYYWFILVDVDTIQAVDPSLYQEQLAINDILTGGDGNGTDNG